MIWTFGVSWAALPRQLPSQIRVVAAVIERDGNYLITQRRSTAVLPGLWEFPGGKVEPGETDEAALRREVRERLGVDVQVKARIASRHHQYEGYSVDLNLYQAVLEPDTSPAPSAWPTSAGWRRPSSTSTRSRPPTRPPPTCCWASIEVAEAVIR